MTEIKPGTPLPATAGVCAYDRDECTVTLALDSEAEVVALVSAMPAKHRVKLCEDDAADNFHLLNGLREAREALAGIQAEAENMAMTMRRRALFDKGKQALAKLDTLLSQEGGK